MYKQSTALGIVEKMPDVMQNVGNSVDWLPDKIAADEIKVLTSLVHVLALT